MKAHLELLGILACMHSSSSSSSGSTYKTQESRGMREWRDLTKERGSGCLRGRRSTSLILSVLAESSRREREANRRRTEPGDMPPMFGPLEDGPPPTSPKEKRPPLTLPWAALILVKDMEALTPSNEKRPPPVWPWTRSWEKRDMVSEPASKAPEGWWFSICSLRVKGVWRFVGYGVERRFEAFTGGGAEPSEVIETEGVEWKDLPCQSTGRGWNERRGGVGAGWLLAINSESWSKFPSLIDGMGFFFFFFLKKRKNCRLDSCFYQLPRNEEIVSISRAF